jgi:hypothetical protein
MGEALVAERKRKFEEFLQVLKTTWVIRVLQTTTVRPLRIL